MTNKWEATIGIEIHLELNTLSKMFSPSHNQFSALANENISNFDVGYPGSLPTVNKGAVIRAIKLAKALSMTIDSELHFDRKHYFYPDLPRGFQITQQFRPIATNGQIMVDGASIAIERIQLEEDTAKSVHNLTETWLDYNRSGVPLIEIITKPVIKSPVQASSYVAAIRQLARFLDISDAKMEEGSLRADLNVSVAPLNSPQLGTKVEIKNINSLANIRRAAELEIAHQTQMLEQHRPVAQVTKRYDDKRNRIVLMRTKESGIDYKYFPEPNIPPIKLARELVDAIVIGETPAMISAQFAKLGFTKGVIDQLINDKRKLKFIRDVGYANTTKTTKVFFAEIIALANKLKVDFLSLGIAPLEVKKLLEQVDAGLISNAQLKQIIPLLQNGTKTQAVIAAHGFKQVANEAEVTAMVDVLITKHQQFITENQNRPDRVCRFLIGQLMKQTKGQVNPVLAAKVVRERLDNIVQAQ